MRRFPADMPLRVLRVLLAMWLIVAPFLLGFGGTFAQRQDTVSGLLLLPMAILGLLVPGTRVVFLVVGAWLLLSPSFSYEYMFTPVAVWHDRILGLLCLTVGLFPLRREGASDEVFAPSTTDERIVAQPGEKIGWSYLYRRPVSFRSR